ncbi:serine/threonine-protein kinase [Shewanella algae]|uniref:serine/threonine-protein kinase n=1 Tax=Shewanella algae TaxID=38313 RepID=UPI001F3B981D|nr:serine/threonine-protein kinase [Shewanella algae]MCE9781339.1 serine/threonine protein kinase [Shewanella algae]MCE9825763.1 serine/threonine protein kinase [Shewanella algae]
MAYRVVSMKGQGGFARVDIVVNGAGRRFAQKTYDPAPQLLEQVGDEHLKRRFIREVKYQKEITHPNVVPIIEEFLSEDPPRFIMPLAECTLKDEMLVDSTLGDNLHTALFDILAGLEFLHNRGLVHRDLKPANVLRFKDADKYQYAISDFGLMSAVNSESSTLTGTNANGGTENYAAPELIGGFRRATYAADIYAFGAILHDIFGVRTQRIPYTELTVDGELGPIVEKCTKNLPIRRYKSVSELRDDLYNVLNNTEITFTSANEEVIVKKLRANSVLTDKEWDSVFIQIDRNLGERVGIANIIAAISLEHIDSLSKSSPDLYAALGDYFVESIMGNSFNFDYCDVLASKAERFYSDADIGLKAKIALAMLYLGTSHNRWYVERKVLVMMGSSISNELAQRIKMEIEVQDIDFEWRIGHLKRSIGVNENFLHPILRDLIQ